MRRRFRVSLALVAALVAAMTVATGAAPATADPGYPSWDDVQAAQANAQTAQAEVQRINGLLAQLRSAAAAAGDLAITRAGEYGVAEADLTAATTKADALARESAEAEVEAEALGTRSGTFVAQLTRTGTADVLLQIFLSDSRGRTPDSASLLDQLSAVSKLVDQTAGLFSRAEAQKNLAASLSAQAAAARTARDGLAREAEKALAAATAAKEAADAQVADQQSHASTLYAQLAALKNTEASVERRYAEGAAAAAAAAAAANSGGGADGFAPPPGVTVDPAGAQEYAAGRLPSHGWDGDQMGCLIKLWNQESGWRADAYNTSSGAYGIPQSLPASKMATAGPDWMTNGQTQIDWGLDYIARAYGSPCAAWAHEISHNWY